MSTGTVEIRTDELLRPEGAYVAASKGRASFAFLGGPAPVIGPGQRNPPAPKCEERVGLSTSALAFSPTEAPRSARSPEGAVLGDRGRFDRGRLCRAGANKGL